MDYFLNVLTNPTVLKGAIDEWPSLQWSPEYLASILKDQHLTIRVGPLSGSKNSGSVLWETECEQVDATLSHFCEWCTSDETLICNDSSTNPLLKYKRQDYWCYVDYKQMRDVFKNHPHLLKDVRWEDLGFAGRDGSESTIWIGSKGSFTPGHYDTYGFNMVAQIYGRKRWHLFPPDQTPCLYPTRIPYEESSVFTPVDIASPDLQRYQRFADATPFIVTLEPGDTLFVPKHWWHFVESLSVSVSINTWVEMENDKVSRVHEAVTRYLTSRLMSEASNQHTWLNPTEKICSDTVNLAYITAALIDASRDGLSTNPHINETVQKTPGNNPNTSVDANPTTDFNEMEERCTTHADNVNSSLESVQGDGRTLARSLGIPDDSMARNPSRLKRHQPVTHPGRDAKDARLSYPSTADIHELPFTVIPVKCEGLIYKLKPDTAAQVSGNNSDSRSCLDTDDDMRRMLVECTTCPSVVSQIASRLQENWKRESKLELK